MLFFGRYTYSLDLLFWKTAINFFPLICISIFALSIIMRKNFKIDMTPEVCL